MSGGRIAIVGDFNPAHETHHAINASLGHAAESHGIRMDSKWVATGCLDRGAEKILRNYDGVLIASEAPIAAWRVPSPPSASHASKAGP